MMAARFRGSRLVICVTRSGSWVNMPTFSLHWTWIVVVGANTTAGWPKRRMISSPTMVLPDPGGAHMWNLRSSWWGSIRSSIIFWYLRNGYWKENGPMGCPSILELTISPSPSCVPTHHGPLARVYNDCPRRAQGWEEGLLLRLRL